jgi:hypothetical protein
LITALLVAALHQACTKVAQAMVTQKIWEPSNTQRHKQNLALPKVKTEWQN